MRGAPDMNFKMTAVLLVVAALVGGFWLLDRERPSTEDLEKTGKRIFRDWKSEDVLAVTMAQAGTGTSEIAPRRADKDPPGRVHKQIPRGATLPQDDPH